MTWRIINENVMDLLTSIKKTSPGNGGGKSKTYYYVKDFFRNQGQ